MTSNDIVRLRLHNQHLTSAPFASPEAVVQWLCAVQAQDYPGAKWALSQRTGGIASSEFDAALAEGRILRTHVMRPTWHLVTPSDIGWLLALTGPRVKKVLFSYTRKLGLDEAFFARCNTVIAQALVGGVHLTRAELAQKLHDAGINTGDNVAMGHIATNAELDAVICSGALRGKQHTYALLAERAPTAKKLAPSDALAELTIRYFTSHGPATAQDFAWWSGLSMAQVRTGLAFAQPQLASEEIQGRTYWFAQSAATAPKSHKVWLLPNYDEYTIAYTFRGDYINPAQVQGLDARGNVIFNNAIVMDGQLIGMWRRTLKSKVVVIDTNLFEPLTAAQQQELCKAADAYGTFIDLPVQLN